MARPITSRPPTLVLLLLALLATLAFVPSNVAGADARNHNRMIKKRIPAGPVANVPVGPPTNGTTDETTTASLPLSSASVTPSAPSVSTALPTTSASSASASVSASASSSSGGLLDSLTAGLGSLTGSASSSASVSSASSASSASSTISLTSSSAVSSTASSSASRSSSSSAAPSTTSAAPSSTAAAAASASTPSTPTQTKESGSGAAQQHQPSGRVTSTLTVFASAPTQSASTTSSTAAEEKKATPATIAKRTVIVLAAVGGSVGLVFLIWTGIRKWKLKPSSRFDERMAPIDWQPTADRDDPIEKATHRRTGSAGSHGSFGSSDLAHGNQQQQGGLARSVSGHSAYSSHTATARRPDDYDVPAHDFTAGAAAPYAPGPAYADLQRGGPPVMSETHGAYAPYSDYDQQYQAQAYGGAAYGTAPTMPSAQPYRGY